MMDTAEFSCCSVSSLMSLSQISQAKDNMILFPSTPSKKEHATKSNLETAVQQPSEATVVSQPGRSSIQPAFQSTSRRPGPRAKSQLPVPSSRGQQTRASTTCSSNNNDNQFQTPPSLSRATANSSSRTLQGPQSNSSNNNYYRNSMNECSHSQDDIWILHRDLHESNE
ncbi:hypothetical protein CHARACLAT_029928 [Characodon lateralis]|uniref:Uncharacterized protein n=1 Tax=Characodon lateralis TaxID=208331 RepID=A0ABU7ERR2_9TELE|nr:hypothetical protein [Characodon lateralis]